MTTAPPTVSCVLITRDRLVPFKESMRCYCEQSYERRELVVASDGTPRHQAAVERFVRALGRDDVRVLRFERDSLCQPDAMQSMLDDLRGDIVCHWTDEDRSVPQRLYAQVRHMLGADAGACVLADRLHFFAESRDVLWVRARDDAGAPCAFADTLLARRRECCPAAATNGRPAAPLAVRPETPIVSMEDAGPLVARVFEDGAPDTADWRRFSERNACEEAFVDAHLAEVRSVLSAHRLPRPLLVAARADDAEPPRLTWRSP